MADVEGLKDALAGLSGALPDLPERLEALLSEAAQARAAVDDFLTSLDARMAEAAELAPRLDSALRGLARVSRDETLRLDQDRELPQVVADPRLSFESTVTLFTAPLAARQNSETRNAVQGWAASKEERSRAHETAFTAVHARFTTGRERVALTSAAAAQGLQSLQGMVEVSRGALTEEVERFGAVLEAQQNAAAQDVEELRKDCEAFEASVISRVDRVREAVQEDADRLLEATRDRLDELHQLLERAVKQITVALENLDDKLKESEDDAERTREALVSQLDQLHDFIGPLRHAIEGVRQAAHAVGIPF